MNRKKAFLSTFWVLLCFLFISISLSIFIVPSFLGVERIIIFVLDALLTILTVFFCVLAVKKEPLFCKQNALHFFTQREFLFENESKNKKAFAFTLTKENQSFFLILEEDRLYYSLQSKDKTTMQWVVYQNIDENYNEEKIYHYILSLFEKQTQTIKA